MVKKGPSYSFHRTSWRRGSSASDSPASMVSSRVGSASAVPAGGTWPRATPGARQRAAAAKVPADNARRSARRRSILIEQLLELLRRVRLEQGQREQDPRLLRVEL